MSVDTPAKDGVDRRGEFTCAVCRGAGGDGECIATYPSEGAVTLPAAHADGLLPLCPSCADEVAELTDAWTAVERPPVASEPTIGESYAAVASTCSFCADPIEDGSVLGVESWTRRAAGSARTCPDHDNYALCGSCVPIFAEFLREVSSD